MISIIISTYWKRVEMAFKHANQISQMLNQMVDYEILIIDTSETSHNQTTLPSNTRYFNLDIRSQNSLAIKRNYGARVAQGEILVFLDDDVLPDLNYFKAVLSELGKDIVLCGNIFYPKELVGDNKLIAYKDSRHRSTEKRFSEKYELAYNNFVAMCFSIFKTSHFNFDENFSKYGFEDIDYGKQLQMRGIKIKLVLNSLALHFEESLLLSDYRKKLYCASRYMFPIFDKKYKYLNPAKKSMVIFLGFFTKLLHPITDKLFNSCLQRGWLKCVYYYQHVIFLEGYWDYQMGEWFNYKAKQDNDFI